MKDRREAISAGHSENLLRPYYDEPTRRLYIGVTNDLIRRVDEHRHRLVPGFTSKYFLNRLVYFEDTPDISAAIGREKELKG